MVIKGDSGPQEEDADIFNLRRMRGIGDIDEIQDQAPDMIVDEGEEGANEFLPKYKRYAKDDFNLDDNGYYDDGADDSDSDASEENEVRHDEGLGLSDDSDNDTKKYKKIKKVEKLSENPLITDLDNRDKDTKRNQRVQLWFEKDNLKEIDDDADEDYDLDELADQYKQKGVKVLGEENSPAPQVPLGKKAKRRARHAAQDQHSGGDDDSSEEDEPKNEKNQQGTESSAKKIRLTEEELVLGALLVQGKKAKRDLIDGAWNRYTFGDENLPEWFAKDEEMHMRKEDPVPADLVDEYHRKFEEINVHTLKKVTEAKARKKRRAKKRFEKAKKKAEAILDNADNSAQEKVRQIKK